MLLIVGWLYEQREDSAEVPRAAQDLLKAAHPELSAAWDADAEPLPLALFGSVIGPDGPVDATTPGVLDAECAMAHELVKSSPM